MGIVTVGQVLAAMDKICKGRLVPAGADLSTYENDFTVTKSSGIPGKQVRELPGLVWGRLDRPVHRIGVALTLTESHLDLAGLTGMDVLVVHHPVADEASCGGVTLKNYLELYDLAIIEAHEAFHGTHPGREHLLGLQTVETIPSFGGVPDAILRISRVVPPVSTLGQLAERIQGYLDQEYEQEWLRVRRKYSPGARTLTSQLVRILAGDADAIIKKVLLIPPHGGFTPKLLAAAYDAYPDTDTIVDMICPVGPGHPLVQEAVRLGLNFVVSGYHGQEIFENGAPLAAALQAYLPELEVYVFEHGVTCTPLAEFGNPQVREYAHDIAQKYLFHK